eukprot:5561444-Pyramimonas_sp.AAC.1
MFNKSVSPSTVDPRHTCDGDDGQSEKDECDDDGNDGAEGNRLRERVHHLGESLQSVKKRGDTISVAV